MDKNNLKWWILLTVIIGTFLGRLDQTVVNLALPKIIDEFSITVSAAGWIATAYILANAIFVPVWGKLGDTIGRKKVYIWGFSIFIVGSVLAGLAWNLNSLLVFRVIQAVASSADYPTAMAILAITFREPKSRAQALGLWSASFATAAVLGPLIGGPLIDMFGWRSIFFINLPVGLLGLAMALMFVDESVSDKPSRNFDWGGAITLGISLSALVFVLDQGVSWGWFSLNSFACYATMLIFFYLFYRIDLVHPEPIVDFKFFKIPAFVGALINNFVTFMVMIGAIFLIPVFAQVFLGYNATETGYLFIPMAFCLMLAAPLGASLMGKVSSRNVIIISTIIAAIGMLLLMGLDARSSAFDIIIPIGIMAFGLGFGMSQRTNIIAVAVPAEEIGVASSILALVRNIAGAFGIAFFATLLNNTTENNLIAIAHNSVLHITSQIQGAQGAALMILLAEINAYQTVFMVSAIIILSSAVIAYFTLPLKETPKGVEIFAE